MIVNSNNLIPKNTKIKMNSLDLTICSVSYNHSEYLYKNIEFSGLLNRRPGIKWLIANNDLDPGDLQKITGTFGESIQVSAGSANNFDQPRKESKHHAAGLNLIVPQVKTRFVLILDPDFFIIRPDWAERVTEHMDRNNISFLGVPWHPKWAIKWRYFPCTHCLFIDGKNIDLSSLDFRPESVAAEPSLHFRNIFDKIPLLRSRTFIGRSLDTGYRIFQDYSSSPQIKNNLFVPSFTRKDMYNRYRKYNQNLIDFWVYFNKMLDLLFPESMSMFPRKKGYFTESSFSDRGFPDCKRFGWEEFFWENRPFAFHVRGFQQNQSERARALSDLGQVLEAIKSKMADRRPVR